jgi:hypothetical protein
LADHVDEHVEIVAVEMSTGNRPGHAENEEEDAPPEYLKREGPAERLKLCRAIEGNTPA